MNFDEPADIAPLPFGASLALGLLILIGLPAEKRDRCPKDVGLITDALNGRTAEAGRGLVQQGGRELPLNPAGSPESLPGFPRSF